MDAEHRLPAPVGVDDVRGDAAAAPPGARLVAAVGGSGLARSLAALAVTRLALLVVGACALRLLPAAVAPTAEAALRSATLASWVRWDAWWYLNVAERGYWFDPYGQSNVAFFPLFPLLVRAVSAVTGHRVIAALLVANVAAVAGVVVLWRWTREALGEATADRAVRWLLVFPFGFFLHTGYAESLYFALTALAFLAAGRGRWGWAGLWGGLAAATRPLGVLLFPALAWAWWRRGPAASWRGAASGAALLLVPAGLGAYAGYLWLTFGTPLAFWHAHAAGWSVRGHWDLTAYARDLGAVLERGGRVSSYVQLLDVLHVCLPLLFAGLAVSVGRRLGGGPALYTAAVVAVGVLFAPDSVGREFLAAVPAFAAAGGFGAGGVGEAVRLFSFGLLVVLLVAFQTAHFVG